MKRLHNPFLGILFVFRGLDRYRHHWPPPLGDDAPVHTHGVMGHQKNLEHTTGRSAVIIIA